MPRSSETMVDHDNKLALPLRVSFAIHSVLQGDNGYRGFAQSSLMMLVLFLKVQQQRRVNYMSRNALGAEKELDREQEEAAGET